MAQRGIYLVIDVFPNKIVQSLTDDSEKVWTSTIEFDIKDSKEDHFDEYEIIE